MSFSGQNRQISTIRDSHFVEQSILRLFWRFSIESYLKTEHSSQWRREKSAKGVAIGSRGAISSEGAPLLGAPYNTFFGVHPPQAQRYWEKAWVTATT